MKITVVTKKPNEKPEIVEFENEIHAYQSYVGGYIECYEVRWLWEIEFYLFVKCS